MKSKAEFSPDVGKVVQSSAREANRLGHNWLDVEHVLLGIMAESQSKAAELLRKLGCDFAALKQAVEEAIQPSQRATPPTGEGNLPLTKETEAVLRDTYKEAGESGHKEIGTEHMLLSLLRKEEVVRVPEGACGITYEQVRAELSYRSAGGAA